MGSIGLSAKNQEGIVSPAYVVFATKAILDPVFLYHFLKSRKGNYLINYYGNRGTVRSALRFEDLCKIEIPLPPLSEQRRIVARIEELIDKIEETHRLRQQTTKEAKALLEATRYEVFSKASAKDWKAQILDGVAPINMGQSPPGESYNTFGDGVPLLNGPSEFGEKHPTEVQWTTNPTKLCKKGDILLCVRGATTGRMNWADKEYCIGRGLAALTAKPEICMPEYVYYFVETQTQEVLSLAAGSTFPNLPGEKLKTLKIPIPSIPEQRRIVAYLDNLQVNVNELKCLQTKTETELDALLPSILDKAFNDEL